MEFNGIMNGEELLYSLMKKNFDCGIYIEWNV